MNFEQWLVQIGKSKKTAKNYSQAIDSSISQWASAAGLIHSKLSEVTDATRLDSIINDIQQLDIFQERNKKGKGMYGAALKQFVEYFDDVNGQTVATDIEQILNNTTIDVTEKSTLISTRIGQGQFRKQLIDYWQGCAITGYADIRFLVASHIKPWAQSANEERLDAYNGLLLLPNLDKVFDLGFVTFENTGKIRLSEQLEQTQTLGISRDLNVRLADRHQEYMAYHREHRFKI